MQHIIDPFQRGTEPLQFSNVYLPEVDSVRHLRKILTFAGQEIIHHVNPLATLEQFPHQCRTDKAGSSCYQV